MMDLDYIYGIVGPWVAMNQILRLWPPPKSLVESQPPPTSFFFNETTTRPSSPLGESPNCSKRKWTSGRVIFQNLSVVNFVLFLSWGHHLTFSSSCSLFPLRWRSKQLHFVHCIHFDPSHKCIIGGNYILGTVHREPKQVGSNGTPIVELESAFSLVLYTSIHEGSFTLIATSR